MIFFPILYLNIMFTKSHLLFRTISNSLWGILSFVPIGLRFSFSYLFLSSLVGFSIIFTPPSHFGGSLSGAPAGDTSRVGRKESADMQFRRIRMLMPGSLTKIKYLQMVQSPIFFSSQFNGSILFCLLNKIYTLSQNLHNPTKQHIHLTILLDL